ncbi:MAG TPA: DivIVA domain-containing protein [Acidimicrobiales bacterium]|jgi:cell division initiation protein
MEVSPKTLREVEFREKMRGYHPEDVDHFLEQVAAGLEAMQERLRQAVERAQRAEAAASDAGGSDETLRKTLVLAQRTADLAVQEAREQAARILAGAEQQAQAMLAEAEDRGRRTLEDTTAECRTELAKLESARAQSQADVDTLNRWLDEHKAHLQDSLSEAMAAVERAGVLWPAPSTRSLDMPGLSLAARPAPTPPPAPAPAPAPATESQGPETALWSPEEDERLEGMTPGGSAAGAGAVGPETSAPMSDVAGGPDDQALDDFFDDNDELADDRRFGGRLRRRR